MYFCQMETKEKGISGSLKVDHKVLKKARKYCKDNGLLIYHFATEAINEKLEKLKCKTA